LRIELENCHFAHIYFRLLADERPTTSTQSIHRLIGLYLVGTVGYNYVVDNTATFRAYE